MATWLDIQKHALRLIGVLDEADQPSGEQSADAIYALEAMFGSWENEGLRLGALVGTTLTNGGTVPLPATHFDAIAYGLALRLAPQYGAPLSQQLTMDAVATKRALLAQYASTTESYVDPAFLMAGRR